MDILHRLILLVCLVFAGQSYATTTAVAYGYEVDAFQTGVENLNYNGLINPSGFRSQLSSRDSQDRAPARAFFVSLVDFDVPKSAANRATHEAYKNELRAAMEKPAVSDPALSSIVDKLYRPNATVGSGSISAGKSKINSDYQSVNEQAGIFAGDGGFQVAVASNTDLKGAIIASTDNAVQDDNNRLTTATLTSSDLENETEYKAKSYSFSAGIGLNQQANGQLKAAPSASAGASDLSDSANSVAVSGVSGGEINITDDSTQQEKTGMDAATTIAILNRDVIINDQGEAVDSQGNPTAGTLKPIFDADKVQKELDAQTQITQAFSQVAPKALADFAKKKFEEYIADGNLAEAEKWKDGGAYRVALHAAVGGLAGNLEGALGAGTSAAVIPEIGDAIDELNIPTELKQALVMATAAAVGSSVGGSTGAGAALSEATNNYLSDHQQALKDAEKENCKGKPSCLAKAEVKWQTISAMQDVGFATGFGGGLGLSAYELAEGMWQLVDHFPETMDAIKKLSTSPEFRQQFGDEYFADLEARAALMKQAYEDAGWNGSVTAGVEAARFTAEIAGLLAVVKGTATVAAKLPEAATKLLKATQNTLTDAKAVVPKGLANLKSPNARHNLSSVTQKTVAKNKNTVIEPGVDVAGDVAAIRNGLATRSGDTFSINGRVYGSHDGTLFPISGPGFHQLDRGAFKALGVFNKFGNSYRAGQILDNMGISSGARDAALNAWRATQ